MSTYFEITDERERLARESLQKLLKSIEKRTVYWLAVHATSKGKAAHKVARNLEHLNKLSAVLSGYLNDETY
jgi:hypothetical protein